MDAIAGINALTARWLAAAGADAKVLSGFGLWPLLAFLADAASSPGREELEAAIGIPVDQAMDAGTEVLELFADHPAVKTALGIWIDRRLTVKRAWADRVPAGTAEELDEDRDVAKKRLDKWAAAHTDDMIKEFPADLDDDSRLVLATALLVQTEWLDRFEECRVAWQGGEWGPGGLFRMTSDLDALGVVRTPDGPLTAVTVVGSGDIDVHLVLGGPDADAGWVLASGVRALGGGYPIAFGTELLEGEPGPGIVVRTGRAEKPGDSLHLNAVSFEVEAKHDLLALAEVFGLRTVGTYGDRLPGISEELYVQGAQQAAKAQFNNVGFRAAAVTAIGIRAASAPRLEFEVKQVIVTFDRPFAYYAVHRPTGLVLAAGWVTEPTEPKEPTAP